MIGIIPVTILLFNRKNFKDSGYLRASGNNFLQTISNAGHYGEYLTYNVLERIPGEKLLLTNIYVPKPNGETSEIDLILINAKGIFVFESKNYSGWIFGDENNKTWTQSIKGGHKTGFTNPIWQNKGHISALIAYLKDVNETHFNSYIVFSERCELKNIKIQNSQNKVLQRNYLYSALMSDFAQRKDVLDENTAFSIFERLQKLTHMDESIKNMHIYNINNRKDYFDKYGVHATQTTPAPNPEPDIDQPNSHQVPIEQTPLYLALKQYRYVTSQAEGVKAYFIFNNADLEELFKKSFENY